MRVYDGFRFTAPDLLAIHAGLMAFRPVIDDLVRTATGRFLAADAVDRIDRSVLKGAPTDNPLAAAYDALHDRQRKIRTTGHRDPAVDHEFVVRVLPFEGSVYGILVSEQEPWKEVFLAQEGVEAYGTWDGDPPEGVSHGAWRNRRELWNRLLRQDPAMRPAGCGFAVDFITLPDWPEPAQILPLVPDRAARVAKGARARVLDACIAPRWDALKAAGPAAIMAAISAAETALREDPAMRTRLSEEAANVAAILPEITVGLLLGKDR